MRCGRSFPRSAKGLEIAVILIREERKRSARPLFAGTPFRRRRRLPLGF
jgi:hypothetical protein